MRSTHIIAATVLAATGGHAIINKSERPALERETFYGCYSDPGELVLNGTNIYNSIGSCAKETCKLYFELPVAATMGGNECYCGKAYPPKKYKVDDSECDIPCVGYPLLEACGGIMKWTVYNTGLSLAVVADDEATPTRAGGSSSGSESTAVKTAPGQTVVVTQPPKEEKSTNTGAIAGGVVVGVLAIAGSIGGMFIYLRRKRNREIEEEHRRNAVNSFTGKAPSSSGMSITDARLDPVMAQRRMSDGSIADNHDYSRKILRVTNA